MKSFNRLSFDCKMFHQDPTVSIINNVKITETSKFLKYQIVDRYKLKQKNSTSSGK